MLYIEIECIIFSFFSKKRGRFIFKFDKNKWFLNSFGIFIALLKHQSEKKNGIAQKMV